MKKTVSCIALATLLSLLVSCETQTRKIIYFSVNGEEYSAFISENDTIDLKTLSTEFNAKITISDPSYFDEIKINGVNLSSGHTEIPIKMISRDSFLKMTWKREGYNGTYYLRTLHSDVPQPSETSKKTSNGDFYLSFVNIRLIEKIDNEGKILFYRYDPIPKDEIDSTKCPGWWDFKKHVINDTIYYSYHAPDPKFYDQGFPGYNPGMRIILNQYYQPIDMLQLLASRGDTIQAGDPIDGHDFFMIDRNHYIMSSYIKIGTVYAAYLQEVNNGEVKFDWLSTDYKDMTNWLDPAFAPDSGNIQQDYVHFNSIDVLPDGNWLCSFRHISSILKINRNSGKGEIMWRIAGAEDSLYSFHGQHYVRYHEGDNSITLFNNGNLPDSIGRTQMLRLNVDTCTGKVLKSTVLHDDGYFTQACGALTFSGKNMIVGWGIPGDTTNVNCNRILSEYDENGNEVFRMRFEQNNSSMNQYLGSYRCVKCE